MDVILYNKISKVEKNVGSLQAETDDLSFLKSQVQSDYYDYDLVNQNLFTEQAAGSACLYYGYAYPIKDIYGIKRITMKGYASANGTIYAGIAKTATAYEKASTKEYLATGSTEITITNQSNDITLDNICREHGSGYIVLWATKTLTQRDHRGKLNVDVVDTTKNVYLIETDGLTLSELRSDREWNWSPTLSIDREVYDPKIAKTVNGNIVKMNHLYVATTGSDETGDGTQENPFASIYKANSVITDNAELNEYTIHVADGTYTDLQTKYAGAAQSTAYQGVIAKDHVYYEGNRENPNAVVIEWDGSYGYDSIEFTYQYYGRYKCPFHIVGSNAGCGKTAIRGFTFTASNTRYCLHIDTSGYGRGVDWIVEDCIFNWGGTPDCTDRETDPPTIGTGSSNFEKGLIKNCIIKNRTGATIGFMNHTCEFMYEEGTLKCGADMTIEGCVFDAGNEKTIIVQFRDLFPNSNYDTFNKVQLINCKGIDTFNYAIGSDATECSWRADVKCTPLRINKYQTDGYMQ